VRGEFEEDFIERPRFLSHIQIIGKTRLFELRLWIKMNQDQLQIDQLKQE
jgi:hypothetical protein